ncbi:hypothetical protein ACW5W8_22375 [Aeromonas aquatilis]
MNTTNALKRCLSIAAVAAGALSVGGCSQIAASAAISDRDVPALAAALTQPALASAQGWNGFQRDSAAMILARWRDDRAVFERAVGHWKAGRAKNPQNYPIDMLRWPGFDGWVSDAERAQGPAEALPRHAIRPRRLRNPQASLQRAIVDNMKWLRDLAGGQEAEELVPRYVFVAEDRQLREAIIAAEGDLPEIVIAFDEAGVMTGSFLMH